VCRELLDSDNTPTANESSVLRESGPQNRPGVFVEENNLLFLVISRTPVPQSSPAYSIHYTYWATPYNKNWA